MTMVISTWTSRRRYAEQMTAAFCSLFSWCASTRRRGSHRSISTALHLLATLVACLVTTSATALAQQANPALIWVADSSDPLDWFTEVADDLRAAGAVAVDLRYNLGDLAGYSLVVVTPPRDGISSTDVAELKRYYELGGHIVAMGERSQNAAQANAALNSLAASLALTLRVEGGDYESGCGRRAITAGTHELMRGIDALWMGNSSAVTGGEMLARTTVTLLATEGRFILSGDSNMIASCQGNRNHELIANMWHWTAGSGCPGDSDCDGVPDDANGDGRFRPCKCKVEPQYRVADYPRYKRSRPDTCQKFGDSQTTPPARCDDNCPTTPNRDQRDSDGDGLGDACQKAWRIGCWTGTHVGGGFGSETWLQDLIPEAIEAVLPFPAGEAVSGFTYLRGLVSDSTIRSAFDFSLPLDRLGNYLRAQVVYKELPNDPLFSHLITKVRVQMFKSESDDSRHWNNVFSIGIWQPGIHSVDYIAGRDLLSTFAYYDRDAGVFTAPRLRGRSASRERCTVGKITNLDCWTTIQFPVNVRVPRGADSQILLTGKFNEAHKDAWCAVTSPLLNDETPRTVESYTEDLATYEVAVNEARPYIDRYICAQVRDRWKTLNEIGCGDRDCQRLYCDFDDPVEPVFEYDGRPLSEAERRTRLEQACEVDRFWDVDDVWVCDEEGQPAEAGWLVTSYAKAFDDGSEVRPSTAMNGLGYPKGPPASPEPLCHSDEYFRVDPNSDRIVCPGGW